MSSLGSVMFSMGADVQYRECGKMKMGEEEGSGRRLLRFIDLVLKQSVDSICGDTQCINSFGGNNVSSTQLKVTDLQWCIKYTVMLDCSKVHATESVVPADLCHITDRFRQLRRRCLQMNFKTANY